MGEVLKARGRWVQAGWVLPLVLLTLPNCFLDSTGLDYGDPQVVFDPGPDPRTSAIMCEIRKVPHPTNSDCATLEDMESGIPLSYAAIALTQGEQASLGLDFSPEALAACSGMPKKVEFQGPFPDGLHVCLNCATQIPAVYVDATDACVAKCVDLVQGGEFEPPNGAQSFCESNATVATNFNQSCFENACSNGGTPNMPFIDPRRDQEPVQWVDLLGQAQATTNNLSKGDEVGDLTDFDTGAASKQTIEHGDAWVEFEVTENDKSHVLGVSFGAGPDTVAGLADIEFAISLNFDGNIYILENGANYISAPLGPYQPGQRFRIRITDNNNGTASIKYTRVDGPCSVGTVCAETELATQTEPGTSYPIRITASFREPNATLANVTLVRIQE
jgi:hypothetical protein